MALRITDLKIDVSSLGDSYLLTDIVPYYEYKDGERTNNILGYRYDVALPHLKMEKLGIKIEHLSPLIDLEKEEIPIGLQVDFKNLEVGSYFMRNQVHIKASADEVFFKNEKDKANVTTKD